MKKLLVGFLLAVAVSFAGVAGTFPDNRNSGTVTNLNDRVCAPPLGNGEATARFDVTGLTAAGGTITFKTTTLRPFAAANLISTPALNVAVSTTSSVAIADGAYVLSISASSTVCAVLTTAGSSSVFVQADVSVAPSSLSAGSGGGIPSVTPVSGTIINTNDAVTFAIQGAYYANAHFTAVNGAAQATSLAVESSTDNVNWAGAGDYGTTTRGQAPMIIRTDAATMNPTLAIASIGSGLNLNSYALSTAWDFPISGVTTYVRVRAMSTTGSAVTIVWSAGVPITSGVPVTATLFDVLGGTNANIDSGVIDFRGWSAATLSLAQVAGTISSLTVTAMVVNDINGSNSDSYAIFTAAPVVIGTGAGATSYGTSYFWGAKTASPGATTIGGALPKRGRFFSGASSGVQTHLRIELIRNQ